MPRNLMHYPIMRLSDKCRSTRNIDEIVEHECRGTRNINEIIEYECRGTRNIGEIVEHECRGIRKIGEIVKHECRGICNISTKSSNTNAAAFATYRRNRRTRMPRHSQ